MSISCISQQQTISPSSASPQAKKIIQEMASKCLKEFAAALGAGIFLIRFIAPPGIGLMLSAVAIQSTVSIFFRSLSALRIFQQTQTNQDQCTHSNFQWIFGANFAILTGYNMQTWIHELGHTLAALWIYKRPQPRIEIYPFFGGMTQFYKTSLSSFGKSLGPAAATCFVVASGPAFTLSISSLILTAGLSMQKQYPEFSKYLISWAILDFSNHSFYAYTATYTDPWNLAHDFVHLSIFGLHPVAAAIGIAAIPIIITLGMSWRKPI